MTLPESTVPFWTLVSELQEGADNQHLAPRAWVVDEQLETLLNRSDQSNLPPEEIAKLQRLTQNRAKKYFHHQQSRAEYHRTHPDQIPDDQCDALDTREDAEAVRQYVSEDDYTLLWRLADGMTYEALAVEMQCAEGTLKARASRARAVIRSHPSQTVQRLLDSVV